MRNPTAVPIDLGWSDVWVPQSPRVDLCASAGTRTENARCFPVVGLKSARIQSAVCRLLAHVVAAFCNTWVAVLSVTCSRSDCRICHLFSTDPRQIEQHHIRMLLDSLQYNFLAVG
jgi:hypothetical protein